ncbi:hypothetical protein JHW43_007285 [Diplocarpon mali]|nr:hypothetical protein JHW43_007285 [Diplocarpon mali]
MASASTQQARVRSRDRDASDPSQSQPASASSTPMAGTKRRFSNRHARRQDDGDHEPESEGGGAGEPGRHSDKRHRSRDWPLVSASPGGGGGSSSITPRPAIPDRETRQAASPPSRRPRAPIAPSKFVEGSMSDRVSQKPPVPYLDRADGDAGGGDGARGRTLTRGRLPHHPNHDPAETSANPSDTSRSSSIFRFGRSIAASFNPTNWKFWTKEEHAAGDDEAAAQLRILQERQATAERMYQELKESGHFRGSAVAPRSYPPPSAEKRAAAKHDSGIGFNDAESGARDATSIEEKRKGRVYLEPPRLQRTGESPGSVDEGSLAPSITPTPSSRPRFNFKKPSLADLKRASLSNIKGAFTNESTSAQLGLGIGPTDHQARRVPSRKDMQKQLKLVKRVSNLEERLKQARQLLAEALHEPMPIESHVSFAQHASQAPGRVTRPKFVPGAMPSLPSERLLRGYVSSEAGRSDEEGGSEIGQALSTDHPAQFMSGAADGQRDSVEHLSSVAREDHSEQSIVDEEMASVAPQVTGASTPTQPVSTTDVDAATPKPAQPTAAWTRKRKSLVPDGDYVPVDASESESDVDGASAVRSDVSPVSKPAPPTRHASLGTKHGATITLLHPKKIQKTGQGAKTSVAVPPQNSRPRHRTVQPARSSSPNAKAPRPLPSTTSRQQSASPPPSSATFHGPGLLYSKSSSAPKTLDAPNLPRIPTPKAGRQRVADRAEPGSGSSREVPPMPPMPQAVRLASGEVISTAGCIAPRKVQGVKRPTVPADQEGDGGPGTREHGEGMGMGEREQEQEHQGTGVGGRVSDQSFEWPDDVF